MKPKILVISDYRATVTVRPEAEIFIALAKQGFEIDIMTFPGSEYEQKFREAGINIIPFHPVKKFKKSEKQKIKQHLLEGKHNILHLYTSKAIYNGIRAAKGLPVKVILYRGYTGNIHWWDPFAYLKYLHPRVDGIICNSAGVEKLIKKQLAFNKEKAITINKGHKLEWYQDIKEAKREEFGFSAKSFILICVANTRRMKGIPYLLKATRHLDPSQNIELLLVGNGLDNLKNLRLAKKSPVKEQIHFMGFRKDALELVKMSDLFVLPSIKGESITKAVIESMNIGTPPIITDIPGNKELVIHGVDGLIVPSRNPKAIAKGILQLYQSPQKLEKMKTASQLHIKNHLNHDHTVKQYQDMYTNMLK